jgi:small GTP-binding protein
LSKADNLDDCISWASDRLDYYLNQNLARLAPSEIKQIQSWQIKLKHHVFEITALGLASCGKTALLSALQGKKIGLTSPLHGTTKDLNSVLSTLDSVPETNPAKVQIKLIDTPGLDEVAGVLRAEIAAKASHQADLILFVTAGDLTRQELEAIAQLKQAYKPILLIFNKTDLYPLSDRQLIHQALQDRELQDLISPDEIIFTSAEPLARRVRLEYADTTQEIWESSAIDVKALKQKILDLLNQDGKSLLAINAMRSLREINLNVTQRQLDKFLPQRTLASGVFVIRAISVLLSPLSVLDLILSTTIDASLIWGAIGFLGYDRWGAGLGLSLINGIILASIHSHYGQIAWAGIATPWFIDWLRQDLRKANTLKKFIEKLRIDCSQESILHRLKFKF